jgi:hypothetical protein
MTTSKTKESDAVISVLSAVIAVYALLAAFALPAVAVFAYMVFRAQRPTPSPWEYTTLTTIPRHAGEPPEETP